MKKIINVKSLVLLAYGLFGFGTLNGQPDSLPSLKTPYHTMYTHLHFLQEENYNPQKSAIVIPPEYRNGSEVARAIRIKRIMDGQGLYISLGDIPATANYRDTLAHRNIYKLFPGRMPAMYLEKIDDKWYYSIETMERLDQMYSSTFPYGVDKLVDIVPAHDSEKYFGLTIWQWIGLPVLLVMAFIMYWIARWIGIPVVSLLRRLILHKFQLTKDESYKLVHLIGLIAAVRLIQIFIPALQFPVKFAEFLIITTHIFQAGVMIYMAFKIVAIADRYLTTLVEKTEHKMDDQLLPIFTRTLKIAIIVLGLVYILRLFNVNVAAIIAGLSLGGLAIALAAQDTVKNFIGSLMIITDRPFQVGDYVSTPEIEGTIVEVGFRTSRVQKIDTSIITIPNGRLADSSVTNLGVRPKRIINLKLGVMYDTPPDKIEQFIEGLRKIILDEPKLSDEPMYVHLNDFAASSIDVMFRCYIDVLTYPEEMQVREEVMFKILRLAESIGVSFAFPSTSVYLEKMPDKKL